MIVFVCWVLLSFAIFRIAQKMNKDAVGALIVSLIFSPFIGLLYVLVSSEKSNAPGVYSWYDNPTAAFPKPEHYQDSWTPIRISVAIIITCVMSIFLFGYIL